MRRGRLSDFVKARANLRAATGEKITFLCRETHALRMYTIKFDLRERHADDTLRRTFIIA